MNKYKNKKIAVLGLGMEGKDAIKYLLSAGANITLLDKKQVNDLDFSGIDRARVKIVTGDSYLNSLESFEYIVRSPGVYRFLPEIIDAEKSGVKITSPIKIFFENCKGKIIGVTGTKGKGTTSTLIYEILKAGGHEVFLAGNIGKPMLELLPKINDKSFVILEMSSFQLIDLDISPHIAVVLNITEDHMDWHKDRNEYIEAKKNIVRYQSASDFAIINGEYETPKSFKKFTRGNIVEFSRNSLNAKYKEGLLLRGEHNLENIAAAVTVAQVLKINEKIILTTVKNFKGLEHRLELVDIIDGVTFYNDSFATGPQPTIAAINSFTEPETLILGGSDKGLDYLELGKIISEKENVKNVILIGTTAKKIEKCLVKNLEFGIWNLKFASMSEIVRKAFQVTKTGGVVVLSPASASFDMFKNYKERGNQFKEAVHKLNEK